jgi:ParB/RepB/Spo0J family partition protein
MSPVQDLQDLPVALIEPNLHQPRRSFDEASLQELAGSIAERGVLQPVIVRPNHEDKNKYQLVAGERRWRAAKLTGLHTIPALISEYDDLPALEVGLIENMARQDLNPIEEAHACVTLVQELGLTYQQLASRVGRSKSRVANLIRLLKLPEEIIELMERGELSKSHGEALLIAQDPRVRGALAREAVEHGWSVPTLKARAHASNDSPNHSSALPVYSPTSPNHSSPDHHAHSSALDHSSPDHSSALGHSPAFGYSSPNHSSALPGNPPDGDDSDDVAMNIARVWGDAVGAEVMVRVLSSRKLRVEFVFDSPAGALAVGGQLAEKVARASKRR